MFPFCDLTRERQVYAKALGSFPDRIKNLYFSYLFLLRAVNKVPATSRPLPLSNYNAWCFRLPPRFRNLIT
jgi:hypothetical protein